MSKKVDVVIEGKVFTLVSSEEEAHLQRIARYIDAKLAEMADGESGMPLDDRVRSLLLALNISDDYFKASDRLARMDVEQEKYITELGLLQQENSLLTEQFRALQGEYTRLQKEHDQFIETFDNAKPQEHNVVHLPRPEQRKVGGFR